MDPWGSAQVSESPEESQCFKDNFIDQLPDHQEYLDKLEKKLEKLNAKSSIVKELAKKRSDEAKRMLDSNALEIEHYAEDEIENSNAIARRLFPEKQALNMSEIAKLLESDALAKNSEEDKNSSQEAEDNGQAQNN